jgi:hypothetical protein
LRKNKYNKATSHWGWSSRFRDLQAAHAWGCPAPSYFDNLSKNDRIDIIAWYEAKWRIDAINTYERLQEQEREYEKTRNK